MNMVSQAVLNSNDTKWVIDVEMSEQKHSQVNHFDTAGNNTSFASESCKPMALSAVIIFYAPCFGFCLE